MSFIQCAMKREGRAGNKTMKHPCFVTSATQPNMMYLCKTL